MLGQYEPYRPEGWEIWLTVLALVACVVSIDFGAFLAWCGF